MDRTKVAMRRTRRLDSSVSGRGRGCPRAVTLLEALLVIGIIMLLAALTWPNFAGAQRAELLTESSRRLRTLIAMCRAEAMNDSVRYRITFRLDGSMKLRQQYDPIIGPHVWVPVEKDWARMGFLLDGVWVESVAPLPDGPPPILVEDDLEQFDDMEEDFEPEPIEDFDDPFHITFRPDGTSDSLRWVLRDELGRGIQMTLDGRLGRVDIEWVERIPEDQVERPPEIDRTIEEDEERARWEEVGYVPPEERDR